MPKPMPALELYEQGRAFALAERYERDIDDLCELREAQLEIMRDARREARVAREERDLKSVLLHEARINGAIDRLAKVFGGGLLQHFDSMAKQQDALSHEARAHQLIAGLVSIMNEYPSVEAQTKARSLVEQTLQEWEDHE